MWASAPLWGSSGATAGAVWHPVMRAKRSSLWVPADSHFFWGAVLLGYLAYDTGYSLACFSLRSGAVMLAHHVVGIAGCVIGGRAALGQGAGGGREGGARRAAGVQGGSRCCRTRCLLPPP